MATILICDDEPGFATAFARLLTQDLGREVMPFTNGLAVLTYLESLATEVEMVIADESMPGPRGTDLLRTIAERWPHIRRVLLTGWSTGAQATSGAFTVLDKSLSFDAIAFTLHELLGQ